MAGRPQVGKLAAALSEGAFSNSTERGISCRITFVCHAPTAAARAADFPADEPAEASGLRDAAALAGGLGRVDRAWTGPEARARQTAAALGLAAAVEPALRGCDHGRWTGLSLAEAQAADGQAALLAWLGDPAAAPHGGESVAAVIERVGTWLDERAQDEGHTVAVSHPEVARAAVLRALGGLPTSFARIDAGPLTRIVLSFNRSWRLRAIVPASGLGSKLTA